ncbi:MAG: hypothetical protein ACOYLU_09765, partial [Limisphaerales bacterium]
MDSIAPKNGGIHQTGSLDVAQRIHVASAQFHGGGPGFKTPQIHPVRHQLVAQHLGKERRLRRLRSIARVLEGQKSQRGLGTATHPFQPVFRKDHLVVEPVHLHRIAVGDPVSDHQPLAQAVVDAQERRVIEGNLPRTIQLNALGGSAHDGSGLSLALAGEHKGEMSLRFKGPRFDRALELQLRS